MQSLKWMLPVTAFALLLGMGVVSQADESKAAGKATVSGTVKAEDGSPVADIEVRVMPPRPKRGEPGFEQRPEKPKQEQAGEKPAPGEGPPRPEPIAKATTDADGKFTLEVPAGKYDIVAGKRNMGMARQTVELKDGETKTVDLTLKKGPRGEGAGPGREKKPE